MIPNILCSPDSVLSTLLYVYGSDSRLCFAFMSQKKDTYMIRGKGGGLWQKINSSDITKYRLGSYN